MSGDPCPVTAYEWKIQRLDGLVIQDWLQMNRKLLFNGYPKYTVQNYERSTYLSV